MPKLDLTEDKDTYVIPLPNGKFGLIIEGVRTKDEYDTRQEATEKMKEKVLLQG